MLTEEKCKSALRHLPFDGNSENAYRFNLLEQLIEEHFKLEQKYDMALERLEQSEWEYKGKVMDRKMWNELLEREIGKNVD